jgi:hypothetical protein
MFSFLPPPLLRQFELEGADDVRHSGRGRHGIRDGHVRRVVPPELPVTHGVAREAPVFSGLKTGAVDVPYWALRKVGEL